MVSLFTTYWNGAYSYIYRCNNFLDNYDKSLYRNKVKKDVYAAEIKNKSQLLRIFMTVFWGDVPW